MRALVTITPPKAVVGRCPKSQKCFFQKLATAALELAQTPCNSGYQPPCRVVV